MSAHNRVVWSEGLFLQPQHFQQQDRFFERYVEGRCQPLIPYSWGFTEIELERDFLKIGKIGLRRLAGVFPSPDEALVHHVAGIDPGRKPVPTAQR